MIDNMNDKSGNSACETLPESQFWSSANGYTEDSTLPSPFSSSLLAILPILRAVVKLLTSGDGFFFEHAAGASHRSDLPV